MKKIVNHIYFTLGTMAGLITLGLFVAIMWLSQIRQEAPPQLHLYMVSALMLTVLWNKRGGTLFIMDGDWILFEPEKPVWGIDWFLYVPSYILHGLLWLMVNILNIVFYLAMHAVGFVFMGAVLFPLTPEKLWPTYVGWSLVVCAIVFLIEQIGERFIVRPSKKRSR